MTERYYPAFLDFKKAGGNSLFVKNKNENSTHIISNMEGNLLLKLSGCKTIPEHFDKIIKADQHGIANSVLFKIMEKWINTGLLRNEILLFKQETNITNHIVPVKNTVSGCLTHDSPSVLKKWLDARLKTEEYCVRKSTIIICDDTRDNKLKTLNVNFIRDYQKIYPGRILFIGKEERKILSEKITDVLTQQVPEDLLDFTMANTKTPLNIKSSGGSINTMFLIAAGHNLYFSDDAAEYNFFSKSSHISDNYYFEDQFNLENSFYPDMETFLINYKPYNDTFKLLERFEALTGSLFSSHLKHNISDSLKNISPSVALLMEKNLLKISIVSTGYLGYSGYQNPINPLLQLTDERENFFYDYENYKLIRDNGLNTISTERNVLENSEFFNRGSFCIDNCNLIPPYLPLGGREDASFGLLINKCLKQGLKLHLPISQYFNHTENPLFSSKSFYDFSIDSGTYSTLLIENFTSSLLQLDETERMIELGNSLQEFGKIKLADFEEQLKLVQLGFLSKKMDYISYLLDLFEGKPSWWAEDMKKYYNFLKKEALGAYTVVPGELRNYGTKEEALTLFRKYIIKCGEMIQWWPEIWEASRQLNTEGRGLFDL